MGFYLNSQIAYTLLKNEARQPYFVDMSLMLEELFPFIDAGNKHICLTRPRRFGKTLMANMIDSFFSKAVDSKEFFGQFSISGAKGYDQYRNCYNVVHISFNDMPRNCHSYKQYINRIETRLLEDIQREFPDVDFKEEDALWDVFPDVVCGTA